MVCYAEPNEPPNLYVSVGYRVTRASGSHRVVEIWGGIPYRGLDLRKKYTCFIADEKPHGLGTGRESCKNTSLLPTTLG